MPAIFELLLELPLRFDPPDTGEPIPYLAFQRTFQELMSDLHLGNPLKPRYIMSYRSWGPYQGVLEEMIEIRLEVIVEEVERDWLVNTFIAELEQRLRERFKQEKIFILLQEYEI